MRVLRWAGRLWTGVLLAIVLLAGLLLVLRLALPLPFLSARPALRDATPSDGSAGILPRARITLRFSGPMNPRSVERTLRIVPAAPAALLWDADAATLTISPTASLQPDATYRITVGQEALSRMFRALERPVELSFHTAPAPAVVAFLPEDGATDVKPDAPIVVLFSRPIVAASAVALPAALPELHFDPPISGTVTWLDPSEALFRPAAPLQPNTRYRALLDAGLSDLGGGQLGSAFAWSFSTSAPRLLATTPAQGARAVGPRAPLTLTFSQPVALDAVRASLAITPANPGELSAATLPDGSQQITYAPANDWRPGATYAASLRAGPGALPLAESTSWSFTVAQPPALTGRFPGEGQALPPGQDIRLIFTTPMDEQALRDAITFTPPVGDLHIVAQDVEARISAQMRPTTAYTLTLPATLADRNGAPLGQEYRIRFQTAPAAPALDLPDAPRHIARLTPGQAAGLLVRRTNLSALNLELYGLDEATIVRTLAFRDDEWRDFQPERYAQPLLRAWSVQLADPLDTPTEDRLPLLAADQSPLPPGAYYLRIRTPDGPRADLLALVSRTRLVVQERSGAALIWATDIISGTPLGGLPVALYQDGGLVERGTTDPSGLWRIDRANGAAQPLIALTGGDRPGVVSSGWSGAGAAATPERYRAFLLADRAAYRPGERVALAGIVRSAADPADAPPDGLQAQLTVRPIGDADPIYRATLDIGAGGLISDSFTLPADAPDGEYVLAAALGDDLAHITFAVRADAAQPLRVAVAAPAQLAAGDDAPVTIAVDTPEDLPLAGAVLSWTLSAERAPYPAIDGYTLGDDEQAIERPPARAGFGQTGADGRFSLVITDTVGGDVPLRYRIAVRATEPGGLSATGEGVFVVAPARAYAAVRLPSRILSAGRPDAVELLAVAADGRPIAGAALMLDVYRRTWAPADVTGPDGQPQRVLQPRDDRILSRSVTSDERGAARAPLTLGFGGEYRVVARLAGAAGRGMSSAVSLWVAERGFTGWRAEPNGGALLIADRATYQPGDTATLLLTAPFDNATVLLTRNSAAGLSAEVRTIRAGQPLTLTLRPEDAPALELSALALRRGADLAEAESGVSFVSASATLPTIVAGRALSVTISPDQAAYAPGATATLTLTTTDERGSGVPADVVLEVVGAAGAPQGDPRAAFQAGAPPQIVTAQLPGAPAPALPAPAPRPPAPIARAPEARPAPSLYWNPALHTSASGVLTLTIKLPQDAADLRALAWAAAADRFGTAQSALAITQPFALAADMPPFVRDGDAPELAARVRSTRDVSQSLKISFTLEHAAPRDDAPLSQSATLAPGESARVALPIQVGASAGPSLVVRATGDVSRTIEAESRLLPSGALVYTSGGALVDGRWTQSFTLTDELRRGWGRFELDLAPSSAALNREIVRSLAAQPDRSLLDEASLLLASAALSDTRSLMQASVDRLADAQNSDGGWGWYARGPSQPFVGAVALEALAAAQRAGIDVPDDIVERGGAAAEAALAGRATGDGLRAQLLYALALSNRGDAAALRALAARPLDSEGLAYVLLAGSAGQASDPAMISRLASLAVREGDLAHWPATGDDAILGGDTSATALALLALERARADGDLIAAARRWLAAARGSGGWSNAYEAARALAALRAADPSPPGGAGRYSVMLNGIEILAGGDALGSTRAITLPLDQLRERNELTITGGGAMLAGYRIVSSAAPAPAAGGIGLLREYLDPQTSQPLDLTRLRAGQLVRVRLSVVVTAARRFVEIEDALPAGVALVEAGDGAPFEYIAHKPDQLTLASAALDPGVYEYSYLLRAVTPGRYSAPAPIARRAGAQLLGAGSATMIEIAP